MLQESVRFWLSRTASGEVVVHGNSRQGRYLPASQGAQFSASNATESCGPTPGTERNSSSCSRHTGLRRRVSLCRYGPGCGERLCRRGSAGFFHHLVLIPRRPVALAKSLAGIAKPGQGQFVQYHSLRYPADAIGIVGHGPDCARGSDGLNPSGPWTHRCLVEGSPPIQ